MTDPVDPRFASPPVTSAPPVPVDSSQPDGHPATDYQAQAEEVLPQQPPQQPPSSDVTAMTKLMQIVHELYAGQQLRAWEVIDGAINKLRNLHLELHRELAPEGETPSDRAMQARPMTDEEWDKHQAETKKEPA